MSAGGRKRRGRADRRASVRREEGSFGGRCAGIAAALVLLASAFAAGASPAITGPQAGNSDAGAKVQTVGAKADAGAGENARAGSQVDARAGEEAHPADAQADAVAGRQARPAGAQVDAGAGDTAASAGPTSFSARAEPSTVRLGEPFAYVVEIVDAPEVRYVLPRPPTLGTLSVREVEIEEAPQGDRRITTVRLEVAIYDALGETRLPDLTLTALRPDGSGTLVVPGVPITVQSTAEGEELDDLRPPQTVRVFWPLPIGIALGVLGLVAALGLARRALLRRRAVRIAPAEPPRSPEERALAALDALQARGAADWRAFYFELSEIVRGFLADETSLAAREMTTTELVDALVAREVPGLSLAQLGAWLERGDLHRFANVPATPEEAAADLEKARAIVRGVAAARRPREEAA